jgi:hypothetical protein
MWEYLIKVHLDWKDYKKIIRRKKENVLLRRFDYGRCR